MNLLIEAVLKISILLAAAAVANAVVYRRTSAGTRHLVWMLAVVGVLLLPILSAALPQWSIATRVVPTTSPVGARIGPTNGQTTTPDAVTAGVAGIPSSSTIAGEAPSPAPIDGLIVWATLLPALYAAGVILFLGRLVADRWVARRLARDATAVSDPEWTQLLIECARRVGVRRPVRLLRGCEHTMPLALGIRRPAIVVPAVADTWDEDRRRAVLLHEMAHVARHDCLTQLLSAVACALYWVHPGVWWVERRLRVERELASDDRALAAGAPPREYAGHLLELAYTCSGQRAPALVVSMAGSRHLEGRMLAVLDPGRRRTTPTLRDSLAVAGIAAALLLAVAAATTTASPAHADGEFEPPARSRHAGSIDVSVEWQQREADAPIAFNGLPGTWEVRPTTSTGIVQLRLSERSNSASTSPMPIARLEGLSPGLLSGAGGNAQFSLRQEAGTFSFEGTFRSGVGAGTYTFIPSASFPAELVKRGLASPTPADQYALARGDIGLAFLDELTSQGYARPDLSLLIRAGEHGVSLDFLREMGRLGYRVGSVEALTRLIDHGVTPQFVRDLRAEGFTSLTADELVRTRDHGVDPEYIKALRDLGYAQLTLEALVRARDHGIDPEYVRGLRTLGHRLTLEELIRTRDHGVDVEYIKELSDLGYAQLTLETLVRARDHGIDPEYVRDLRSFGFRLTLEELITTRDHGVDADYIRELRDLGYAELTLETLVRARDHGIDPEYIRGLTALGYKSLPLESLIRLRDHGVTPEYVQELKRRGRDRLTIDELIRLRDSGEASVGTLRKVDFYAMLKAFVDRWWN